jgi:small nuclear ribonucleoprotein F
MPQAQEVKLLTISRFHSINEPVLVRLKWGQTEYKGRLVSVDSYMNIQLGSTEEYIDGKNTGTLGMVLIR